jgi:hypothetical protein
MRIESFERDSSRSNDARSDVRIRFDSLAMHAAVFSKLATELLAMAGEVVIVLPRCVICFNAFLGIVE